MTTEVNSEQLELPSLDEWTKMLSSTGSGGPYIVIVYNDDWHTFEQVIAQLCKATGCSEDKANEIANEIHFSGRAVAFAGSEEQCEHVANVLREIKLQVETDKSV
jgi:ATP-dependent Clp protease adaptor protein ClpS